MNDTISLAGFSAGEAEQLVTDLRACWRKGDTAGAHAIFKPLIERLAPRIQRAAQNSCQSRPEMIEDAVSEAVLFLWERLTDLRELPGLKHWERRFHQALRTTLLDAFKHTRSKFQKEYEIADSFNTKEIVSGKDPLTRLDILPSEAAQAALDTILTENLLATLPEKQRVVLAYHLKGETHAEIASGLGCSQKSVYNWLEQAKARLRAYYTQEI